MHKLSQSQIVLGKISFSEENNSVKIKLAFYLLRSDQFLSILMSIKNW